MGRQHREVEIWPGKIKAYGQAFIIGKLLDKRIGCRDFVVGDRRVLEVMRYQGYPPIVTHDQRANFADLDELKSSIQEIEKHALERRSLKTTLRKKRRERLPMSRSEMNDFLEERM